MTTSQKDKDRLQHICQAISDIELVAEGRAQDIKTYYALERLIEIIGEAAKQISPELKNFYPEVCWQDIIAMRNFLAHEYNKIDYSIIWQTIDNDIPVLKKQIEKIFEEIE